MAKRNPSRFTQPVAEWPYRGGRIQMFVYSIRDTPRPWKANKRRFG